MRQLQGKKLWKKQAFFSSLLRKLPPGAVLLIAPCLSSASWGLKEVQQSVWTWLAQRCWLSTSLEAAHFSVQLVSAHFTYTSPAAEYAAGYTARAISWCFIKQFAKESKSNWVQTRKYLFIHASLPKCSWNPVTFLPQVLCWLLQAHEWQSLFRRGHAADLLFSCWQHILQSCGWYFQLLPCDGKGPGITQTVFGAVPYPLFALIVWVSYWRGRELVGNSTGLFKIQTKSVDAVSSFPCY